MRTHIQRDAPTLIFERSRPGRHGTQVHPWGPHAGSGTGAFAGGKEPKVSPGARARAVEQPAGSATGDGARATIPTALARTSPVPLPEVQELQVVRHYIALSREQYGIDTGFYPLGSCTMKYNPKIDEALAYNAQFAAVHPSQPAETLQGFLELLHDVQEWLAEVSGMDAVSVHPAAGAQGEFAGMLIFKRYFEERGETQRTVMLVPDSAHGTNPASAHLAGFEVGEMRVRDRGGIVTPAILDEAIEKYGPDNIAGIMLTNPSTLGTFEEHIQYIAKRLHEIGALLYYDGANLNALVGHVRPGDMGFDLVHINTHKTFSTPHGGGGPGVGPIGVKEHLRAFLPHPFVNKRDDGGFEYVTPAKSIGRLKLGCGQFLLLLRCWAYMLQHGPEGLRRISEFAILNANYMQARLKDAFDIPYGDRPCMHEFVVSGSRQKAHGVRAFDLAKALLNAGFHAPTVYFPLIVDEALMIEPTETEAPETLDAFIDAMLEFARLAESDPDKLKELPNLRVTHLDETYAARNLNARWVPPEVLEEVVASDPDVLRADDSAHVEHKTQVPPSMKPKNEAEYEESPTI
jgi:glycine dehydrogenase subunit 2